MTNRMLKGKRVGIAILAVALAAVLLFAACVPAPTVPAEEQKVVEIGFIGILTGPGASADQPAFRAWQDYVRYFNEEEGIPGVTIELRWSDGGYVEHTFLSVYRRFKERGVPLLASNAQWLPSLKPIFEKDRIPVMSNNSDQEAIYPAGWLYFSAPTWAEHFAVWCDWIMDNWEEERPPRVAFLGSDMQFTWGPVAEGTKYAESIGIEMLPTEIVPRLPLDTTPQLLRLRERGADFVYVQMLQMVALPLLLDAERLDLLDEMQFGGMPFSAGATLIQKAGAASEGYSMPKTHPMVEETEIPGIKLMQDVHMKYHGDVVKDSEYMGGWIPAPTACEAVRRAVEDVGYENIDGPAIKEAFDSIKDFDVYGLKTITYTAEDHRGSTIVTIYQIRDGEIVRVSDWRDAPMLVPEE